MEQIITLFSEVPFLVKLFLAYAMTVIFVLISDFISYKDVKFLHSLYVSLLVFFVICVFYAAVFLFVGCLSMLFRWRLPGWNVFYCITFIYGVIFVLSKISAKDTSSHSSSSYCPSTYSSGSANCTSSAERPKISMTTPKESKSASKSVFLPDSKPQQPTDTPAGFKGNMANIENKLKAGISVRLDYQLCWWRMGDALEKASRSGAKITFYNVPHVQYNTVDNMIKIAKQAPGQVYFEGNILAGFEAENLAASGACFTCDCSNGSSLVTRIAANTRKNNGRVTFVNCSRLNFTQIEDMKAAGGDNVELF